ncbi:hypothetical protein JFU13_01815 [Peribacillus sp. TH24]|nr:hypothetical protein [Peribacillus sp. TH24]
MGLLTAFITGLGIDMWLFLLHNLITPELWYSKDVCFGIGLVVIGLGTATYLHTNFAPIPVVRLTLIIQELTRANIFFENIHLPRILDNGNDFKWTNWRWNIINRLFKGG